MRNIVKFFEYYSKFGIKASILKVRNYYVSLFKWRRIVKIQDLEGRFTEIFNLNAWNDSDSVSGTGSSLDATELLRSKLPGIFEELKINSIFDAPCGDFSWMKLIFDSSEIKYTGADIVSKLVDNNNSQYANNNISFIKVDITDNEFPKVDLMFCRDCLFHLSFSDISKVLINFVNSDIDYLMTTTHINLTAFENSDIASGDYRKIDLFSEPFGFPRDNIAEVADWLEPEPERKMCVWTRDQIKNSLIDRVLP
jgi:hypothetical protein